jgi:tetratricopeptide (TPR) repeat protein
VEVFAMPLEKAFALWCAVSMPALGQEALQRGDPALAVTCFQYAVLFDPTNARLHTQLGAAYQARGDRDRALAAFGHAIHLDPKFALARALRGQLLEASGGPLRQAIGDYERAIELAPDNAQYHFALGRCSLAAGAPDKAIVALNRALYREDKARPQALCLFYRGNAYNAKRQPSRALKDYDEALRLWPALVGAHVGRGCAYQLMHDLPRARAAYDEALRHAPKNVLAYYNRAGAWRDAHHYEWALSDLTAVLRLDAKHAPAYRERGVIYARLGSYREAINDFSAALRLGPPDADVYFERGNAYNETGNYAAAEADYRQALRLGPKHFEARSRLIRLLAACPDPARRNLAQAEAQAHRLGAASGALSPVCATLAAAHARDGELGKAVRWQKRAVELLRKEDRAEARRAELVLEWYRRRAAAPKKE